MLRQLVSLIAIVFSLNAFAADDEIIVGGKGYTEQRLLAEMTTQYLKANGFDVDKKVGLGSAVLRQALENQQISLNWDYVSTGLRNYHKVNDRLDAETAYQTLRSLDVKNGIEWLTPSKANNTYAIAMREEDAERLNIQTISDLVSALSSGEKLVMATNVEFYARKQDGLPALQKTYQFRVPRSAIRRMDSGLVYSALQKGQVDFASVFATDGRIKAFGFRVLKDDRNFFMSYAITPVVRTEVLEQNPGLETLLNTLANQLNDTVMVDLNSRIDVDRQSVEQVVTDFLTERQLI